MTKVLIAAAAFLLLAGPLLAAEMGIPPLLAALAGVACGLAAAVRAAQPWPESAGAPSPGAEIDAQAVGQQIKYQNNGIGITDVGGSA